MFLSNQSRLYFHSIVQWRNRLIIILNKMRSSELINEFLKSQSYERLLQTKEISEEGVRELIKDYFPRLGLVEKLNLQVFLGDEVLFEKMQRILQAHQEISSRVESIEQQIHQRSRNHPDDGLLAGKKITRAALARRHEKNQEQIRKDQIFVRLTPKSQGCIQFMLCNRNFPRMECKLSCNQHLEYLVNYLTNKWIRGKVGYKIVLYPDNSFLKAMPIGEKEKALKEPLNNYLMFTDIMTCCGVHQNGILNLCYEIVEIKKLTKTAIQSNPNAAEIASVDAHSNPINLQQNTRMNLQDKCKQIGVNTEISPHHDKNPKNEQRDDPIIKLTTPSKFIGKDDYLRDASMFNRNSNFYNNNEESLFGSLGFNFNFGATPAKRDQHLLSINSINYLDPHFHEANKRHEEKRDVNITKDDRIGLTDIKVEEVNESASERSNQIQSKKQSSLQKDSQQNRINKDQPLSQDLKLGTLMSFLDKIEKQKSHMNLSASQQQSQNNNSNKIKDVKFVNIVKKRTSFN